MRPAQGGRAPGNTEPPTKERRLRSPEDRDRSACLFREVFLGMNVRSCPPAPGCWWSDARRSPRIGRRHGGAGLPRMPEPLSWMILPSGAAEESYSANFWIDL